MTRLAPRDYCPLLQARSCAFQQISAACSGLLIHMQAMHHISDLEKEETCRDVPKRNVL